MSWRFRQIGADEVEQEPTQREQFNNDDVTLATALVREAIQNSLDARRANAKVQVRISLSIAGNIEQKWLESNLSSLRPHLKSFGISPNPPPQARLLRIEDFGTTGLRGSVTSKDDKSFSDFWRRHGRSHKTGSSGGRWGLGKLVYSGVSEFRCFFGLTRRLEAPTNCLMGQAVLGTHRLEGFDFSTHGFFCKPATGRADIQVPFHDDNIVDEFCKVFNIQRRTPDDTGLSIVIPHVNLTTNSQSLQQAVIEHYYFPILQDSLEVSVTSDHEVAQITSENIIAKAEAFELPAAKLNMLNFVRRALAERRRESPYTVKETWVKNGIRDAFDTETLNSLRSAYKLSPVHIRLLISLEERRQNGISNLSTYIDVFLQKADAEEIGGDLYVRGAITIPAEAKFAGRKAFGLLIADEVHVSDLLGEAENAAHTRWNTQSDRAKARYRSSKTTIAAIKKALLTCFDLLDEAETKDDVDALKRFFSIEKANTDGGQRPGVGRDNGPGPLPPKPPLLRIEKASGAIRVYSGPGFGNNNIGKRIRVRCAYDLFSGNPFKNYTAWDFEIGKDISYTSASSDVDILESKENFVIFLPLSQNFTLELTGFDQNRDVIVDATLSE